MNGLGTEKISIMNYIYSFFGWHRHNWGPWKVDRTYISQSWAVVKMFQSRQCLCEGCQLVEIREQTAG